jgi:ankyrin repeat protein
VRCLNLEPLGFWGSKRVSIIKDQVGMQEDKTSSGSREASRIILEHGMLGEGLSLSELERMRGVSKSVRRWAESGRTLAIKGMLDPARPEQRMRTWMSAVRRADASMMSKILEAGGRDILTLVDSKGRSSLYVAAASGNLDVVRLLLTESGDDLLMHVSVGTPECSIPRRESCLYAAAKKGHVHVVLELLQFALRTKKQNELLMLTTLDGYSCLYAAVQEGHLDVVNALLPAGGRDLLMLPNMWGGGCLTLAAESGELQIVKALINWATGSNGTLHELLIMGDENASSALHLAAEKGHLDVVNELLRAGGQDLLMLTSGLSGDGCLHFAACCKHVDVVEVLLDVLLAFAGNMARDLLMQTNHTGQTCLSRAINEINLPVVNALLEAGSAKNCLRELIMQQDIHGKSCLHFAVEKQHLSVMNALLDATGEATPELLSLVVTRTGNSCLHLAVNAGRVRRSPSGDQTTLHIVNALLQAGGRELVMQQNNTGDSCLHLAAANARWLIMKALLQASGPELWMLENDKGEKWMSVLASYIREYLRRE